MKEYTIYPEDNEQKFHELCRVFEQTYPQLVKEKLLVDPLDEELIQAYQFEDKRAVIVLERVWFCEIQLRANFVPEEYLALLQLEKSDGMPQSKTQSRGFNAHWQKEFTPLILMRGKKYFEEGNVRRIQRSGNVYIAQVAGTEDYEVEISMDEDDIEEMLCTCPYARDNNCKHMAAVLFALESEDVCVQELPPAKHPTIVSHVPMELPWLEAIDNLPEDVIRKELLKQADRDGRLKERLAVLYLGKLPEYQLQNWRASLQETAGEYTDRRGRINDEDAWEFLNELSNFLSAKLPLLFEVGSIIDIFQLIWIVMETALEWEIDDAYEQLQDLFQDCKDGLKKLWAKATEAQREQMMQWYQEHRNEEWSGGVDHMDRVFRSLDQPEPSVTEKRIVQYFGVTPHFLRDGEWVPFPRRSRLYYDFIEDTTAYKEAMPIIEEIIKENLGEMYGCFGSCHTIWHQQKQLLMEMYGIEWFSPAELNRHVCFD